MRTLLLLLLFFILIPKSNSQDTLPQTPAEDKRVIAIVKLYLTESNSLEVEVPQYDKSIFTMDKLEVLDVIIRIYLMSGPVFRPHEIYQMLIDNVNKNKDLYEKVYGYNERIPIEDPK